MEIFSSVRVVLAQKENLKGMATVKVADAIYLTGLRIIEGKRGLFVSMPAKKEPNGDYKDIYFPASLELRNHLQDLILAEYYKLREKTTEGA